MVLFHRPSKLNVYQKQVFDKVPFSRQEFEFQGFEMRGPAASLFKAGAVGRHQNNIKRDWHRQMGDMNYDHRVTWKLWNWKLVCWDSFLKHPKQNLFDGSLLHSSKGTYFLGQCATMGIWR